MALPEAVTCGFEFEPLRFMRFAKSIRPRQPVANATTSRRTTKLTYLDTPSATARPEAVDLPQSARFSAGGGQAATKVRESIGLTDPTCEEA